MINKYFSKNTQLRIDILTCYQEQLNERRQRLAQTTGRLHRFIQRKKTEKMEAHISSFRQTLEQQRSQQRSDASLGR